VLLLRYFKTLSDSSPCSVGRFERFSEGIGRCLIEILPVNMPAVTEESHDDIRRGNLTNAKSSECYRCAHPLGSRQYVIRAPTRPVNVPHMRTGERERERERERQMWANRWSDEPALWGPPITSRIPCFHLTISPTPLTFPT
jgi:hypothetical protein